MKLGLRHGLSVLADYDPGWSVAFEDERTRLFAVVGDVARGIEHYGSTAVVGLRAKPIIDILLGITPLDARLRCKAPLETLGYDYAENAGVPGHPIFGRANLAFRNNELKHVFNDGCPGGPGTKLWPELRQEQRDIVAFKSGASAFFPGKCDLPQMLERLRIDTLLIAGAVTNICCESSARDAVELGYRVIMASDALSGQAHGLHEATLATFYRIFGDVRPSGELMELLAHSARGAEPERNAT